MPNNLITLLEERKNRENAGITFIEGSNSEHFLSYHNLYSSALKALAFLQRKGLRPKDELVLQIEDNKAFIVVFWACILGGIVPVPLSVGMNEDHRRKVYNVWSILQHPYLVATADAFSKLRAFATRHGYQDLSGAMQNRFVDLSGMLSSADAGVAATVQPDDIAFIQFSSGSTGTPKGVMVTHKNLVANIRAIGNAARYTDQDSMLNWMPLTHDMGLIGFHLSPLYYGLNHYILSVNSFVRRPSLWLEMAGKHKATILGSPNFGYNYILRHSRENEITNWNLSHVRIIYNGAEPISKELCDRFLDRLSPCGLKRAAMCPVYGLAEGTLAVAISRVEDEVVSLVVSRISLQLRHKVEIIKAGDPGAVTFVNVGKPVDNCSVRIAGEEGNPLPPGVIGHVQIKGESVTTGYYNNKQQTEKTFTTDGWLRTGDVGFMKDGNLYITGREKDIIFVNGQNFYAHDLEQIAAETDGTGLNKIVVCGYTNSDTHEEEVIAFVLHRGSNEVFAKLAAALKAHINAKTGVVLNKVIPVTDIPRTTSGKLQRHKLIERFREGIFAAAERPLNELMREEEGLSTVSAHLHNHFESTLLQIWKALLGSHVQTTDQKFFDSGGNSLKAAEMCMLVARALQVELPATVIYERQTIRGIAQEIETRSRKYIPIPVAAKKDYYPLSASQRRLYYFQELNKTSIAYNVPVALRLGGNPDAEKLASCLKMLIARHDTLRMSFHMMEVPVFAIHDTVHFAMEYAECAEDALTGTLRNLVKPFDLTTAPLCRAVLLKVAEGDFRLFLDFHHIAVDGFSVSIFINELIRLYCEKPLPALPVQYKDYVAWQQERNSLPEMLIREQYWCNQLQGALPVLEMPPDNMRAALPEWAGGKIPFQLESVVTEKLRQLAIACECTLHELLYAVYTLLLFKYTGQHEIMVGIPVANRTHPDVLPLAGMFVNNLAIRSSINGEETFAQFLQSAKTTIRNALSNQDYPFDDLIQKLDIKGDSSRNPLFDTMFIYQNMGLPQMESPDFSIRRYFFDPGISKFDISMEVFDDAQNPEYYVEYNASLFNRETISRFGAHFNTLIKHVIEDPHTRVSDIPVLEEQEYCASVVDFNETGKIYPDNKTLHQLIGEQASATPEYIAIECKGEKISYRELYDRARRLAVLLREKDVLPDTAVGIAVKRSPALVIAILGVLQAGGCYVPVDAAWPAARTGYIIGESACRLLLTDDDAVAEAVRRQGVACEVIDIREQGIAAIGPKVIEDLARPENAAYILYTSGSTGNPKGVTITHKSLVNYVWWAGSQYVQEKKAAFPLFTSIGFDLTVTSLFVPLITGNTIVIYDEGGAELPIAQVVSENRCSIVKLTPAHLSLVAEMPLPPGGSAIKRFIVGGEELTTGLARRIYEQFSGKVEIYNEYGPTEATVGCMIYRFDPADEGSTVPIGAPAANTQIYLLDEYLQPVATGVKGEIFISGDGLARGYLHNEVLTREKFIDNPFIAGQRMYRSGDTGKRLPSGYLEFTGRRDRQIKLNGYRIEIPEIEHCIRGYAGITEAVVSVDVNEHNRQYLYACFTSRTAIDEAALRHYLAGRLPHYMIPAHFMRIEAIPLTQNGKINYSALPAVAKTTGAHDYEPAQNEIEALSVEVWQQVLNTRPVGTTDNFFLLGGDSIKAVMIASRLYSKGIVVQAKDILTYHTIRDISRHAALCDVDAGYTQGPVSGYKSFTPVEAWFFAQKFKDPGYYNQSVLLRLNRKVQKRLLETAFEKLVDHHDGLRLNYDPEKNRLFYNNAHLHAKFSIVTYGLDEKEMASGALARLGERIKSGFDITTGLLIRAAIIQQGESDALLIAAHHIVIDGVSWRILLEDLYAIYTALEKGEAVALPAKTASLLDWENALHEYGAGQLAGVGEIYWEEIDKSTSVIPTDFIMDDYSTSSPETITGILGKEKTRWLLYDVRQAYNINVPIICNTALLLALKEWTGGNCFVIEQENHGRHLQRIDVSRTTGWFTAMYPVKLTLHGNNISSQLLSVKEQLRSVPGHGIGYGIWKYLKQAPGAGKPNPAVIRFNYLGKFDTEVNNDLFAFDTRFTGRDVGAENEMTAHITFDLMIIDDKLQVNIHFNKHAFRQDTMERLKDAFFSHLCQILDHISVESTIYFTPSDFDAADLSQEELDALF